MKAISTTYSSVTFLLALEPSQYVNVKEDKMNPL